MQCLVPLPHSKKVLGSILGSVFVQSLHVLQVLTVWVINGYSGCLSIGNPLINILTIVIIIPWQQCKTQYFHLCEINYAFNRAVLSWCTQSYFTSPWKKRDVLLMKWSLLDGESELRFLWGILVEYTVLVVQSCCFGKTVPPLLLAELASCRTCRSNCCCLINLSLFSPQQELCPSSSEESWVREFCGSSSGREKLEKERRGGRKLQLHACTPFQMAGDQ